jgi:hypothetical protein
MPSEWDDQEKGWQGGRKQRPCNSQLVTSGKKVNSKRTGGATRKQEKSAKKKKRLTGL